MSRRYIDKKQLGIRPVFHLMLGSVLLLIIYQQHETVNTQFIRCDFSLGWPW